MKMEKDLNKIRKMAQKKEKENEKFRIFLKSYDHHQVDKIVHKLNKKYLSKYDCTECSNCCKKLTITLTLAEIKEIAEHLNISYEKMKKKYIERETPEGFIIKGWGCPFLQKDNKCSIYSHRPEVCSSYPHLYKDNINHRLLTIFDNYSLCPIVYNIIETLKEKLWSKEKVV